MAHRSELFEKQRGTVERHRTCVPAAGVVPVSESGVAAEGEGFDAVRLEHELAWFAV